MNELQVAGLTVEAVDLELTRALAAFLERPEVTVSVKTFAPRGVSVLGEVRKPGAYPLDGARWTLLDAFGHAGGPLRETARLEDTVLLRWCAREGKYFSWTIDARPCYWQTEVPLYLQADDVVFVPNSAVSDVNLFIEQYITRNIPVPGMYYLTTAGG